MMLIVEYYCWSGLSQLCVVEEKEHHDSWKRNILKFEREGEVIILAMIVYQVPAGAFLVKKQSMGISPNIAGAFKLRSGSIFHLLSDITDNLISCINFAEKSKRQLRIHPTSSPVIKSPAKILTFSSPFLCLWMSSSHSVGQKNILLSPGQWGKSLVEV